MTGGWQPRGLRRAAAAVAVFACAVVAAQAWAAPGGAEGPTAKVAPGAEGPSERGNATEPVVFVGNNWEGTADVLRFDPPGAPGEDGSFERIARLNIIPDIDERMIEILMDPERLVFFLGIRLLVGEGNDQYVDDMYSTKDGRLLIVSRPSLRDVIGLDIASGEIVWRFVVAGQRSDHMAMSPDGNHVAVSASTGNVVHILDVDTGEEVGRFDSGDSPHENIYSKDGTKIYHASIGLVYTPADHPLLDTTKGERYFQIVDAAHPDFNKPILKRIVMGEKLEEAGHPDMSSAVRPMALSPDERFVYLQVSFFHGFIEYDLEEDRVLRLAHLPDETGGTPRELYLLDSAHHGIAMNAAGTTICAAGTMSDYAAIVSRDDFEDFDLLRLGEKPYWSTTSDDGRHCLVSWSGTDAVSAISYAERREIARIDVGHHPQRVRTGVVRRDWAGGGLPPPGESGSGARPPGCSAANQRVRQRTRARNRARVARNRARRRAGRARGGRARRAARRQLQRANRRLRRAQRSLNRATRTRNRVCS